MWGLWLSVLILLILAANYRAQRKDQEDNAVFKLEEARCFIEQLLFIKMRKKFIFKTSRFVFI